MKMKWLKGQVLPRLRAWSAVGASVAALIAGACSREPARPESPGAALSVVCTTGMVADVVARVGGERVGVVTLMGPGVDPHLYKATPGDLRALAEADLVFYSGLHLEGQLADVLKKLGGRKPSVALAEVIPTEFLHAPPDQPEAFDPHVWFDVALWTRTIDPVLETLSKADPTSRDAYATRAAGLRAELDALDAEVRQSIGTIPEDQRILVTAHDAFGYFGAAYGLKVMAIQGISTESEASLADVNALVDLLVTSAIPAVFVESSVPRKTVEALIEGAKSRGHTVSMGGELFSDAMGPPGTPEGTYAGMIRYNTRLIVAALGGGTP